MEPNSPDLKLHQWQCRIVSNRALPWRDLLLLQATQAIPRQMLEPFDKGDELWLVRQVNLRFVGLHGEDGRAFAKQLGQAVSRAISEAIARGQHGPNVKHYPSRAHHLADFAVTLLDYGTADAWYFERLKEQLKSDDKSELAIEQWLDRLVMHHSCQWPSLSRLLVVQGRLIAVLRRMSTSTAERLWQLSTGLTNEVDTTARLRPIMATAIQIWQCLSAQALSPQACQSMLDEFIRQPHPDTDWQDATHLSEAVWQAVKFLISRQRIQLDPHSIDRLHESSTLLASLDWLDQEWLMLRLRNTIVAPATQPVQSASQGEFTPTRVVSQRERDWQIAWQRIKTTVMQWVRSGELTPAALRLAASAVLLEQLPACEPDATFAYYIDRMVSQLLISSAMSANRPPVSSSPGGRMHRKISAHTSAKQAQADQSEEGLDQNGALASTCNSPYLQASQAGAWLLLRSIHDLRLPALCRRLSIPGPSNENLIWFFQRLLVSWSNLDNENENPSIEQFLISTLGIDELPCALKPESIDAEQFRQFFSELQTRSRGSEELISEANQSIDRYKIESNDLEDVLGLLVHTTARMVLEHWGRQLKGLGRSSTEFLQAHFLQRRGVVRAGEKRVDVWMNAAPLDVALQVLGLLDPFDYFVGTKITKIIYYTRMAVHEQSSRSSESARGSS